MDLNTKKSLFWGGFSGSLLLILYFLILALAQGFSHVLTQFNDLWYLIVPLVLGFGIQAFLFSYIHFQIKERKARGAAQELGASAGISTVSMIACCAHHLTDIAPFLGFSAVLLFLADFQIFFLILGIASNIFGIILMLETAKRMDLLSEGCRVFVWLNRLDWRKIKFGMLPLLILTLGVSFFVIRNKNNRTQDAIPSSNQEKTAELLPLTNDGGGVSIEVTPVNFSLGGPIRFNISFTTHQGSLDFDLTRKARLFDNEGNEYFPKEWQGGVGGHHLSGVLVFSALPLKTSKIRLVIEDIYGVASREFIWDLE